MTQLVTTKRGMFAHLSRGDGRTLCLGHQVVEVLVQDIDLREPLPKLPPHIIGLCRRCQKILATYANRHRALEAALHKSREAADAD